MSILLECRKFFKISERFEGIGDLEKLIRHQDWQALIQWLESNQGLHAGTLRAAVEVNSKHLEKVDRAVRSYLVIEKARLEKGLTALATIGSNAPFIGLFGTVLGIIQAFAVLGQSQADSNSVMAGVSEALIATAIGLFVAIPAVLGYNYFSRKLRLILVRCESLKDLYLSRIEEP